MLNPEPIYRKPSFWRRVIPIILLLWFLYAFRQEYSTFFDLLLNSNSLASYLPLEAQVNRARSVVIALLTITMGIVFFLGSLQLVSQFVLPVRTASDRQKVFKRLLLYFLKMHGPAVFVREGEEIASPEELKSSLPGVAFVDLTSAVVLERQPYLSRGSGAPSTRLPMPSLSQRLRILLEAYNPIVDRSPVARAMGPGIVFTRESERIRGIVSLRKQFRIQLNVETLMKDGFKVSGHVIAIFSLGDMPEVIRVGYVVDNEHDPDPFRPENLRGFQIDKKSSILTSAVDEFDEVDRQEIHRYAMRTRPASEPEKQQPESHSPYVFSEERVFRAVYADANRPNEGVIEKWQDLPIKVAVEAFRNLLSAEKYSDLYKPTDASKFPFGQFRGRFSKTVRNQAVLSFQFIRRRDGKPFVKGQPWNEADFEIFPARPLQSSKVLRDRGIRMIVATSPEIKPTNPAARQQQLDYWRSLRQREAGTERAHFDYQEVKVRAHAKALAEREIVHSLQEILEDTSITPEAMALRVLQALESFAHQPAAEGMLPSDALRMLSSLHDWMFVEPELPPGDYNYSEDGIDSRDNKSDNVIVDDMDDRPF